MLLSKVCGFCGFNNSKGGNSCKQCAGKESDPLEFYQNVFFFFEEITPYSNFS